jgi:hypothetical protein
MALASDSLEPSRSLPGAPAAAGARLLAGLPAAEPG